MKHKVKLIGLLMMSVLCFLSSNAQTVKFKQVMYVDSRTGTEYNGSNDIRFITFSNNYNSFQFTNANGQLINDTGSPYLGSWSYCNQYFSVYDNGFGGVIATPTGRHYNPRTFTYQGMKNGKKEYRCRRSVCDMQTNKEIGYIYDYIYFTTDMKHFSIYSGGSERDNGIGNVNARSVDISMGNFIYVYETADGPSTNGTIY